MPLPRLDFAARPPLSPAAAWLPLAVGCVLSLVPLLDLTAAAEETERWQEKAAAWQAAARNAHGSRTAAPESADLRPRLQAAAEAIDRLTVSWSELYGNLETSADETVSLLAVQPDPEKAEVHLSGEARDFAALRRYLERLAAGGALSDPRLTGHDVRQNDAQKPIVFRITAAWRTRP